MLTIRKSKDRGHFNHDWLDTSHTFSFAEYYDPDQMGFGVLRVINEDHINPSKGFSTHPHRDMEIISYVVAGEMTHKDTMGNTTVIRPGEVQTMSAGTGVKHSEYNHSTDKEVHLLQIWILPDKNGYTPSYGQMSIDAPLKNEKMILATSKNGRKGSLPINQDADVYIAKFKKDDKLAFEIREDRKVWVQMLKGLLSVNDQILETSDGLAVSDLKLINIQAPQDSEFILFDLPG